MTSGIYRFINNRTSEVYVGQSMNIEHRRKSHYKELKLGTHHNSGMQQDYNSGDKFTFEILEEMPNATREELENREIFYIEKFDSFYAGYNQTPGGEYDEYEGRYDWGGDRLHFAYYKPFKYDFCPKCGGKFVEKEGKYGKYARCNNYPSCDFTCSIKIVNFNKPLKTKSNKTKKYKPKKYKTEFEKFRAKKNSYLTKLDCEYLSKKYDIDTSNVTTVKKTNPLIKNYLKETDQWETAIKDLYNTKYSNKSKSNQKPKSKQKSKSNQKPVVTYNYAEIYLNKQKESKKNNELNKTEPPKNITSTDLIINENLNYCSGCGNKINLNAIYCDKCGKKIDKKLIPQKNGEETWAVALVGILIGIALLSFAISNTSEGPISTIASTIFVIIACFFCAVQNN